MKIETTYVQVVGDDAKRYFARTVIDLEDTIFDVDSSTLNGDIFRHAQSEHGRCTGKVRIYTKSRGTIAIGWAFEKRTKYEDCDDTFLMETWVTLLDKDETTRVREYHEIGR